MAKKVTPKKKVTPVSHHISYLYEDEVIKHAGQISDLFGKVNNLVSAADHTQGAIHTILDRVETLESAMDETHEKIWNKGIAEEIIPLGNVAGFDVSGSVYKDDFCRWIEDARKRSITHWFTYSGKLSPLMIFNDKSIKQETTRCFGNNGGFGPGNLGAAIQFETPGMKKLFIYTDGKDAVPPLTRTHIKVLVNL